MFSTLHFSDEESKQDLFKADGDKYARVIFVVSHEV